MTALYFKPPIPGFVLDLATALSEPHLDKLADDFSRDDLPDYGVYALAYDDELGLIGAFHVLPMSKKSWQVHATFARYGWGKKALTCGKSLISDLFGLFGAHTIFSLVPQTNRLAIAYAHRCGFRHWGRLRESFHKGDNHIDMALMGVVRKK